MQEAVDVLVAGAGPVGLTAALELARRGVRVRVVDAAAGPAVTSRAIAVHPRTLETYDQIGVLDEMLRRMQRITAFTVFAGGRRVIRLDADYTASPTRFPFSTTIDQVLTEEVLRDALAAAGVTIEWGVRLGTFTHDDHGVHATLHTPDGDARDIDVPWLIGADGGHSTVRKQLGLPLIGEANETWLLADADVTCELPRNSIYLIRAEGTMLMMAPMPGGSRWRMLDTVDVDHDGDARIVADRFARKLTAGLGHEVSVADPNWVSVFTAQQRMVPAMRAGRCFVAGDAAHVHSPASGQGMNTGIQEAYNLGWKLASVIHGHAGDRLLDSYGVERVPIGQELLASTGKATKLVALKNALAGVALPLVFGLARRVPPLRVKMQRTALGRVAGLGVRYPDSPLTGADEPGRTSGPAPGERVTQVLPETAAAPGWRQLVDELRDLTWTLLVFPADDAGAAADEALHTARRAQERHGAWLTVRTASAAGDAGPGALADPGDVLRASLGARAGSWLLIRPDGYLAARGAELTEHTLAAALAPAAPRTASRTAPEVVEPLAGA
ncbi:oxygenase [Streptomyces sp. SID8379]|uniref:FAD-dependent oxidoreductase n=1 Tax=unclassified Streptomyces TaxID=2593676 RepID=UPI000363BC55|nr:FAD-dependent oxidoreductase [Streptomyces sp. HmicA12]MYW65843.1 oxygenase [Streptomyces sp. SID8379]